MANTTGKSQCITCGKEKAILKCGGCTQDFCYNHFGDHRQQLNKQLEEVQVNGDLFRQSVIEQTAESQKHPLIQQIDQWELNSINKIQETAQEAREILLQHTTRHIKQIEEKLNKLTDQLRQGHKENDFVETDVQLWNDQLTQLTNELNKSSNITLRQDSKPFVPKLYVDTATESLSIPQTRDETTWAQNGITVAGGNGEGSRLDQLARPLGMYVDGDQTIYIADRLNHRIIEWKCRAKNGQIVAGGNGKGNRTNQLNNPTDVVVDKERNNLLICDPGNRRIVRWPLRNGASGQTIISDIDCNRLTIEKDGYLYVSDGKKHEVKRWKIGDTNGVVVAGGNGRGDRLDQLSTPSFIFLDQDHSVHVSDWGNHRVMKWLKGAREGIVVAGGQGEGNSLTQLSRPQGMVVDRVGNIYIADSGNNRVIRWCKGAKQGTVVVGGNGEGQESNQFNTLHDLSFDQQGNLYVVDPSNYRVQKFNIDSTLTF